MGYKFETEILPQGIIVAKFVHIFNRFVREFLYDIREVLLRNN